MRSASWLLTALAALAFSTSLQAQNLTTPGAPQSSSDRPTRGMSMERVESTFGAPANRIAPVGEPPIARWEYPGFVVYFEHNLVIHAVARS